MAVSSELVETIRRGLADREQTTDVERLRRLVRVEIESVERLTYHARSVAEPEFTLKIDEPRQRGGQDQGPSPLIYFLTGVGACLLNQFVRLGIARELDLRFLQVQVKGELQGKIGGGFEHITQELYAEGSVSPEELQELAEKAEALCYIHNTLSKATKMTVVVHLNGTEALRRISGPG